MARRIVISCEHGMTEPHDTRGGWVNPTCSGGRVLDPGEVLKGVYVAGSAIEPTRYATVRDVLEALAGGEQP